MVAVAIALGAAEAAGQHVGAKNSDCADDIGQGHVMAMPLVECFFGGLGKAKVDDVAEALLHAVIFIGFKKLQRAENAQLIGAFGAEFILAAFTPRDGKEQNAGAFAA